MLASGWPGNLLADDLKVESAEGQAELTAEGIEFFESKIRPVLVEHCDQCHSSNSNNIQGGLRLDSMQASQQGGDSGPAVVPGDLEESLLINALEYDGFEMPPKGKLPDAVIEDFREWIRMGAPDPRDGDLTPDSVIDFEQARQFWSFQPVVRPKRPDVINREWPVGEIDWFVLSKLEEHHLSPVNPASKPELIRRATFGLLGLPPTPEEIDAYIKDESDDAFAKVIDRLLASKHYGERWGRYWLDVARYAEDQAHKFAVRDNNSGYRYRDWVIRSFNNDLPYDQFVRMQIAGDLMTPVAEGNYDHLVSLGFFGLGAQYYKNSDKAKAMADELDDRVDTLTRGFLGLTVSCARCHDHKFDPIPTQDYYSLAGIFSSSRLHNAPLCTSEEIAEYNEGQKAIKLAEEEVKKFLAEAKVAGAESRVDRIADYMKAAWRLQLSDKGGQAETPKQLAEASSLNEFLLSRWVSFLEPKQQGKINALDSWFELTMNDTDDLAPEILERQVTHLAQQFQDRVEQELRLRNAIASGEPLTLDVPHSAGSPRYVSPIVTKLRPTASIKADIRGAKELYLIVDDGGNGRSCDHADWISPRLIGEKGELKLTELKWKRHEGDLGARVNGNYQGNPIRVDGKEYPEGIGVHAKSTIIFDLPEGYERFEAIGGLDNSGADQGGCGDQASVQFSVYTEPPTKESLLAVVLGKDGPLAVPDKELEKFLEGGDKERLVALRSTVERAKADAPAMYAVAHSYTEGKPQDMKVFIRGNPARQSEVAPRRFLQILQGSERPHYTSGSGRLELANAIADPDNPLTARVMVNRIWQHHFGRGIVGTPSNFGKLGETPTHPKLLDYLTVRFVEQGWSIKQLHREIMMSATYQLGATPNSHHAQIDADNRYLWRANRRRLDVESWRDSLLDISGELDRTMGGASTNLGDPGNVRRTIYGKISRHELDSLLRIFDFPDANITSSKRSETTVPQQQLFVLNSEFMVRQAKAFSSRLHREIPSDDQARIERGFRLAFGRLPTPEESELGLEYLAQSPDPDNDLTQWESYTQVLLGSNELLYVD